MGKYWHRLLLLLAGLALASALDSARAYDCSKKYCTRMQSCGEAYYKLTVCHQHGLDRDNDGIPCEVVCGDDIGTLQARLRHEGMTLAQPPAQAEPPALLQGDAVAHPEAPPPAAPEPETAQRDVAPVAACTGKRRCKQMLSCAEARFYLTQCGVTSLDADRDGVPCESLCQGR